MLKKVGFIGAGNLAEAIIKGLSLGKEKTSIIVTDLLEERLNVLKEKYGVFTGGLAQVVEESDVLILAVKPKDIAALLKSLAGFFLQGKLVISAAAGIPLKMLEKGLPGVAVVRVMPNTSCAVLLSMTGMVLGSLASDEDKLLAEDIFCRVGKVLWVAEDKINAVTAVSGSGPAYYYLFTECLAAAGAELGLTAEEARLLAQETFVGASQLLISSRKSPNRLREDVTSPNGTTYAAIQQFEQANLKDIVLTAAISAAKRAAEMEREFAGE
ncbi:MAG: pyrroline-5-carboxylate reductase [Desulfitobacteriaceae bacterium]|nr:pyrroline-5-carboxylate reductase [Desulfitobacteriaceae bacterium]MDD4345454.1 pyrroline-5-carboxylate reductase [Desulfitobacteriaceae bacterium]MDD4400699.1 pyrroline-5-carboxylate reductase [Desulfitobacteriaceae bacterium]